MLIADRYVLRLFTRVLVICFLSLTGLFIVIDAVTNLDEFRNLTADLDVDYDNLRGEIKDAKIQAFLEPIRIDLDMPEVRDIERWVCWLAHLRGPPVLL